MKDSIKSFNFISIFFCKVHSSHAHGAHKHLAGTNIDATQSHEDHDEAHTQVDVLKNQISQVEPDVFIGLSLCCGFVFMLLIDHISGGHAHAPPTSGVCCSTLVYSILLNESLAKKKTKQNKKQFYVFTRMITHTREDVSLQTMPVHSSNF